MSMVCRRGIRPGEEHIGSPFDPEHCPVSGGCRQPNSGPTAYGLRSAYRSDDTTAFFRPKFSCSYTPCWAMSDPSST